MSSKRRPSGGSRHLDRRSILYGVATSSLRTTTARSGSTRRIAMGKTASKARRPAREDEAAVTPSSGNVFADLGLRDADELLAKADLAHTIQQLIEAQGLSQRAAARCLGVAQPDLSNLYRARLEGFSIERLCRLLTALGQDVRIALHPNPRSRPPPTLPPPLPPASPPVHPP